MTALPDPAAMPGPAPATVPTTPPPLSEVFAEIAAREGPRVVLRDILDSLRNRSFAPVLILLAVPNLIPFIPGSSAVLGLMLALLAIQLILGFERVWLPRRLNDWSFERGAFRRMVDRIGPYIVRFERMARPRYWPTSFRLAERGAGVIALALSLMIMLPIPLANGLPAVAICLIALGLSERDGVWLGAGILTGVLGAGVVAGIYVAGVAAALHLW